MEKKKENCQICGEGKQEITCEQCGEVVCPECSREGEEGMTICSDCYQEPLTN